jgi:hypothetical protein
MRMESNKISVKSSNKWMESKWVKNSKMEEKRMNSLMSNSMRCLII